jgi:hypothetical protein
MHVMDNRGEVWKTIVIMIPVLGATLIAVSRIVDHRHHPFDVITGSMLGIFVAWASYRQYFPPVSEPWKKGRAHSIRTWGTQPIGPPVRLLAQPYDDAEPLRNPDEEMLSVSRGRQLSGGSGIEQSVSPAPLVSQGHTRRRRHRDREAAYSSSSSEDVTDALEMTRPSGRPGNLGHGSPSPYEPYSRETAYPPAVVRDATPEAASNYPVHNPGRPLTSISRPPEVWRSEKREFKRIATFFPRFWTLSCDKTVFFFGMFDCCVEQIASSGGNLYQSFSVSHSLDFSGTRKYSLYEFLGIVHEPSSKEGWATSP